MNEQELPLQVDRTKLTVRLDATITVFDNAGNQTDWLKPGTEMSQSWPGIPSETELVLRYRDMTQVTQLTLEDTLVSIRNRLREVRQGG